MSEYCLDCWNEISETNDPKEKYILSKELDLCEGCGEMKQVIIPHQYLLQPEGMGQKNRQQKIKTAAPFGAAVIVM